MENRHDEASSQEEPEQQQPNETIYIKNDLVQIKARSEDEIQRRIQAFVRNKRNEVNERNIREFICPFSSDSGNSCARVDAVYVHREASKSHVTLKRAENSYGPQTVSHADDDHRRLRLPADMERAQAVEERLVNMEEHLNMTRGSQDVYKRLKDLEERIMFLEGVSPEYFSYGPPACKRNKPSFSITSAHMNERLQVQQQSTQPLSLTDLNRRIKDLKDSLKRKSEHKFAV